MQRRNGKINKEKMITDKIYWKKLLRAYHKKKILSLIASHLLRFLRYSLRSLKYIFFNPASKIVSLHSPEYIKPAQERKELEIVERILG